MHLSKKTSESLKKGSKEKYKKRISGPEVLEIIWEQVFPEDTELRIRRAFEMLLNNDTLISNGQDISVDNNLKHCYSDPMDVLI